MKTPPCHGGDDEFEPHMSRYNLIFQDSLVGRAAASYAEGHGIVAHSWDSQVSDTD